jgi:hypothetical protein
MISALVLAASILGLAEFFIAYCRSLIAATAEHVLSDQAGKLAGAMGNRVSPESFAPIMQLVKLCPKLVNRNDGVTAVKAYFAVMTVLASASRTLGLGVTNWADHERTGCAFFAAVALDRRIAHNRQLFVAETANSL